MATDSTELESHAASTSGVQPHRTVQGRDVSVARPSLVWDIQTCATMGPNALLWGDYHFAVDLAETLTSFGQTVRVLRIGDESTPEADVVLHLRGHRPLPPRPGKVNLLWVISHPDDVCPAELLDDYDRVYAAGPAWAVDMSRRWNVSVEPLLQAVNRLFTDRSG